VFDKILVANRGEIAVRIIRTAHEMGIAVVAVYSDADRDALHVRLADEAYHLGPSPPAASYLDAAKLLEVARRSGAQAIHPGYGFFAENAGFARQVTAAGLTWIGPHADAIDAMGDKLRARRAMEAAGVPFVPGGTEAVTDAADALRAARAYGLPLALKASGGGGGKGLKVAYTAEELAPAFETARREAELYFKNGTIYAERYLDNPKHVELQILADKFGNVVHAGERDCSLQRRHQKLWEEAPALISDELRGAIRSAGIRAAAAIGYDSVGTIECLVAGNAFYFLEMNTRIQVEHTVTEMISGIDFVREQIRVAAGEPLDFGQADLTFDGFAIEGRVNAEDPARQFRPAPGTITGYREPGGPGVRIDSAAYQGWTIPADYDSLIAKLVVWAPTRARAIDRLRRAIDEYVVIGVPTTLPLLRALCDHPLVVDGTYGTATLEAFAQTFEPNAASTGETVARVVPAIGPPADFDSGDDPTIRVEVDDKLYRVRVVDSPFEPTIGAGRPAAPRLRAARTSRAQSAGNEVVSPMHGAIVALNVAEGASVAEGQVVAVIEAMKMMNEIRAHRSGVAIKVHGVAGDAIEAGSPLVTIE
jgi:acetyl-CoA/propionyl-CoA carboxylase biotin carboxyl carrier protein